LNDISQGIEAFSWPGRFEVIIDNSNLWFLDGAHNEMSITHAAQWFAKCITERGRVDSFPHILIYTHISDNRDGGAMLECLAQSLKSNSVQLEYVIFTTYKERQDGSTRIDKSFNTPGSHPLVVPVEFPDIWRKIDPEAAIINEQTIEGALNFARRIGEEKGGMQTLVTGSLHLIGGALNLLRPGY